MIKYRKQSVMERTLNSEAGKRWTNIMYFRHTQEDPKSSTKP